MLDEEERQDTQMREHFKEKWTPKPSTELTVNLREDCAKYRAIVENATHADKIVKEKYNNHRQSMELLSKSDVSPLIFVSLYTLNIKKEKRRKRT